uniref:Uncharacterized protein n=1 Tax=Sphaerodactylus townsendi TaxID=933632 RepID=A0ACB8EHK1_9SAUR
MKRRAKGCESRLRGGAWKGGGEELRGGADVTGLQWRSGGRATATLQALRVGNLARSQVKNVWPHSSLSGSRWHPSGLFIP